MFANANGKSATSDSERRRSRRMNVRLPARISISGGPFSADTGLVEDLSDTGMRVYVPATREELSDDALRQDHRVRVTLIDELGDVVFRGECKLVWHQTRPIVGRSGKRYSYMLGLQIEEGSFLNASPNPSPAKG